MTAIEEPQASSAAAVPAVVEFGYPSIQFSPKFCADGPSIFEQIEAAADAGYAWIALDRHTADDVERRGGFEDLAALCSERLPCRELQALIVSAEVLDLQSQVRHLALQGNLLGAPLVLAVIKVPPGGSVRRFFRQAVEHLARECPGIRIGIEFGPLFSVQTLCETLALCAELALPQLGVIVDSWHFLHGRHAWTDLAGLPREQLFMVHFSDHGALGPGGITVAKDHRLLPGTGTLPLAAFVSAIGALGYRGPIELEVVSAELRARSVREYARITYQAGARFWTTGSPRACASRP